MNELLKRRGEIVDGIYSAMYHNSLDDEDQEDLARFNALIMMTGSLIASLVEDGKDGKNLWRLYSWGVQQIVYLFMTEG